MSKRELIQRICEVDQGARAELLANYSDAELVEYLEYWQALLESKELVCACDE